MINAPHICIYAIRNHKSGYSVVYSGIFRRYSERIPRIGRHIQRARFSGAISIPAVMRRTSRPEGKYGAICMGGIVIGTHPKNIIRFRIRGGKIPLRNQFRICTLRKRDGRLVIHSVIVYYGNGICSMFGEMKFISRLVEPI